MLWEEGKIQAFVDSFRMQKEFSNDCTETMNRFVIIGMYYVLFACQNNNKSVYNLPMKTLEVCIIEIEIQGGYLVLQPSQIYLQ